MKTRIFIIKWMDHLLFVTSLIITIATDSHQTCIKMWLRDKHTVGENSRCRWKIGIKKVKKTLIGLGEGHHSSPSCTSEGSAAYYCKALFIPVNLFLADPPYLDAAVDTLKCPIRSRTPVIRNYCVILIFTRFILPFTFWVRGLPFIQVHFPLLRFLYKPMCRSCLGTAVLSFNLLLMNSHSLSVSMTTRDSLQYSQDPFACRQVILFEELAPPKV